MKRLQKSPPLVPSTRHMIVRIRIVKSQRPSHDRLPIKANTVVQDLTPSAAAHADMIRGMDEKAHFLKTWNKEAAATRAVLSRIPEGSDYRPDPKSRSAREIAWLIVREEILLAVRGPGALLGEVSAVDGGPRSASVAALEPVEAVVLTAAVFVDFLRSHAAAATVLLQLVVARLRDADRKRIEFAAYDIASRVARRLVELAERFGEPDDKGVRITVALSQDELAGWVGASREAVAKALRVLRDRGLVTTGRRTRSGGVMNCTGSPSSVCP